MFKTDKNSSQIETAIVPPSSSSTLVKTESNEQFPHTKTHKCITDAKIARKLLKHNGGNKIVDIKPLHNKELDANKEPSNFIFELTDKLISDYKEITGFDLRV